MIRRIVNRASSKHIQFYRSGRQAHSKRNTSKRHPEHEVYAYLIGRAGLLPRDGRSWWMLSRYRRLDIVSRPGINGGTNWHNPAFDPDRRLIFIPAIESTSVFTKLPPNRVMRRQNELFVGSCWSRIAAATNEVLALDAATGERKWKTPDAKSGAFHLAGTPNPPRSHLRSADDR